LLAVQDKTKNLFASLPDHHFGLGTTHRGLIDECCRYIYNVRDFPRSLRFVYDLLRSRHHDAR
jgi:hypothetical protein